MQAVTNVVEGCLVRWQRVLLVPSGVYFLEREVEGARDGREEDSLGEGSWEYHDQAGACSRRSRYFYPFQSSALSNCGLDQL